MSSIKRRPGPIDRGVPQKRYDDYDVRFEWIFQSKQFFFIQGWLAQQVPGSVLGSTLRRATKVFLAVMVLRNSGITIQEISAVRDTFQETLVSCHPGVVQVSICMGVINGHPLTESHATMSLCSPSLKENSESRPNTIELLPTVRFSQLWGGLHCKGAWRVENHGHGPWVKFMTYSNPMQSRIIDRNPPLVSVNSVGFDVCIFWRV